MQVVQGLGWLIYIYHHTHHVGWSSLQWGECQYINSSGSCGRPCWNHCSKPKCDIVPFSQWFEHHQLRFDGCSGLPPCRTQPDRKCRPQTGVVLELKTYLGLIQSVSYEYTDLCDRSFSCPCIELSPLLSAWCARSVHVQWVYVTPCVCLLQPVNSVSVLHYLVSLNMSHSSSPHDVLHSTSCIWLCIMVKPPCTVCWQLNVL